MSDAFDRFIAGHGPMAKLIAGHPRFEPPEGMLDRVLAAVDTPNASLSFEPPASLEAAVLAEAARLDAAQAPRRDALLDQIASGADASTALGADVSQSTTQWLAGQANRRPPAAIPRSRPGWKRWLNGFGVAATAALAASVALKVWMDPAAPTMERSAVPMTAQDAAAPPVTAKSEVFERESDAMAPAAAPPAAAPADQARAAPAPLRRRAAETTPTPSAAKPEAMAERKTKVLAQRDAAKASGSNIAAEVFAAAPSKKIGQALADADDAREAPAPSASLASAPMAASSPPPPREDAELQWDLPLATPGAAIAQRMTSRPPQAWVWTVHPAELAAAREKRSTVMAVFAQEKRPDSIRIETADRPTGSLRIQPAGD